MHITQHAAQRMSQRGVTVVDGGATLITAYNLATRARPHSNGGRHV